MKFQVEHTDTFSGEANYSWVKRQEIELPENASDRSIVMAAKKALGLTGVKCKKEDLQGDIILRPIGICQIIFITVKDEVYL